MTDLTPLKTLIVDALTNHAVTYNGGAVERASLIDDGVNISFDSEDECAVDALLMNQAVVPLDRLATTILDGILDRDRVLFAIKSAIVAAATDEFRADISGLDPETEFLDDTILVDRLIASLAGGLQ